MRCPLMRKIVFTFVGDDRPGLVETLARLVSENDGNWLESRLSHMAGKFAGIVTVAVPAERSAQLANALTALGDRGLTVVTEISESPGASGYRSGKLDVLGNDRPGIVREISSALAALQINIQEFCSQVESAPMAGIPLFSAQISIALPAGLALELLAEQLDYIANSLDIDISLETGNA